MESNQVMYVKDMESPMGKLSLAACEEGLCGLTFGSVQEEWPNFKVWMKKNQLSYELKQDANDWILESIAQLQGYFNGARHTFDVPVALKGTPFQIKVWQALQTIPFGETKSYKEIAEIIGSPKAVRAVGGANNKNPISIIVPCHRVIGTSGALVGYGGGLDKKEQLLNHEKQYKA